jgi:hypothetical protein
MICDARQRVFDLARDESNQPVGRAGSFREVLRIRFGSVACCAGVQARASRLSYFSSFCRAY